MKGIERTPSGGYSVRWRDAAGHHRRKTFKKGEGKLAQAFKEEVGRAKRLGYLPRLEASRKTVGQLGDEWWRAHGSNTAPKTQTLYAYLWNKHILPYFAAAPVGQLTVADVERWLAALQTGPIARRKACSLLSQIINYARRTGEVQANPCDLAKRPKLPEREPVRCPSPVEVEGIRKRLLDQDRVGDAALVTSLAYAGLRPHEARRLVWPEVKERTILARPTKTGRHRAVTMLPPVKTDLGEWRGQANGAESVFTTAAERPMTADDWDNWRARVWADVAPKGMRPYDLRHAFVSLLLRDPAYSRVEVASQAGHSLQVQDDTYAHVIAELGGTGSAEVAIEAARQEVFGVNRRENR